MRQCILRRTMEEEKDLRESFGEVLWLASDAQDRLSFFEKSLKKHKGEVREETRAWLQEQSAQLRERYAAIKKEAEEVDYFSVKAHERLRCLQDLLRTYQAVLGSLLSAADWQSPTFDYSLQGRAGLQAGRIEGTRNDYKRDQHLDAEAYEAAFAHAYAPFTFSSPLPILTFLTSSGMSAWSTVAQFAFSHPEASGPVFAGKDTYFQGKRILERFCPDRLEYFDEMDADGFLEQVRQKQPGIIFLDTLGNTPRMAMPDMDRLIPGLRNVLMRPCILVIDNSILGPSSRIREKMSGLPSHLRIIVVESLNKLYQFGMDRVTGGVMWSNWIGAGALFTWRMQLGTNISDTSVLTLPTPHRAFLEKRLRRLGRNAQFLAASIEQQLQAHPKSPLSHVVYPSLPSHAAYTGKEGLFAGPFFVIAFREGFQKVSVYQRFLKKIMEEAKTMRVDLVAGTSFGMNTTRLYLTALHTDETEQPFVRISVGTETAQEMEKIRELFSRVIASFS